MKYFSSEVKVKSLSRVRLFATPWTVAYQAPPSTEFSRQEYWSGLPFPSPGDLPNPEIEPGSPAFQADALTSEPPGKQYYTAKRILIYSIRTETRRPVSLGLTSAGNIPTSGDSSFLLFCTSLVLNKYTNVKSMNNEDKVYLIHSVAFPSGTSDKEPTWGFTGAFMVNAEETRDADLIPGSGVSPRVGNINQLQHCCLKNSTGREYWQTTVHGVTKSQTQLSNRGHSHTHMLIL